MTDGGIREWVESLGIREASAVDAVVEMCRSQGFNSPSEAAGTATKRIFSEAQLKKLLAGQKMNVRKKLYNGLERLGGRDGASAPGHSLASPDAPVDSAGSHPENHAVLKLPSALPDTSGLAAANVSPTVGVQSTTARPQSPTARVRSPSPGWSSGDRALVKEIFEIFNTSRDGRLNHSQYAAFCAATEAGASCNEDRWQKHIKSIRNALQKHSQSCNEDSATLATSREEQERGLSLEEFSMLYFAPALKKHYGQAAQDLALAKAPTAKSVQRDVFGGGDWGAKPSSSTGSGRASPSLRNEGARTVVVEGLQSMNASIESEEKVLRHFQSFGKLDAERSQLRPPNVNVVFFEPLSAQKAIFIGENMAMSVGGHSITLSLLSYENEGNDATAKRRKLG